MNNLNAKPLNNNHDFNWRIGLIISIKTAVYWGSIVFSIHHINRKLVWIKNEHSEKLIFPTVKLRVQKSRDS